MRPAYWFYNFFGTRKFGGWFLRGLPASYLSGTAVADGVDHVFSRVFEEVGGEGKWGIEQTHIGAEATATEARSGIEEFLGFAQGNEDEFSGSTLDQAVGFDLGPGNFAVGKLGEEKLEATVVDGEQCFGPHQAARAQQNQQNARDASNEAKNQRRKAKNAVLDLIYREHDGHRRPQNEPAANGPQPQRLPFRIVHQLFLSHLQMILTSSTKSRPISRLTTSRILDLAIESSFFQTGDFILT